MRKTKLFGKKSNNGPINFGRNEDHQIEAIMTEYV